MNKLLLGDENIYRQVNLLGRSFLQWDYTDISATLCGSPCLGGVGQHKSYSMYFSGFFHFIHFFSFRESMNIKLGD